MVELIVGTQEPIKIALVVRGSDVSIDKIADFIDELSLAAERADLLFGDTSLLRITESNNAIITIPTLKTAVNEQVIEVIDRLSEDMLDVKEIWVLCDDVEDHPEILKA